MEIFKTLLVAFGGQLAILAALAWFGKRFFDHFLTKAKDEHMETIKSFNNASLETLKASLNYSNSLSIETLKSNVGLLSGIKKYRFEKVYEKQMEILERSYKDITHTIQKLEAFVSPVGKLDENRLNKGMEAYDSFAEVHDFCVVNKIWLKKETADRTIELLDKIYSKLIEFRIILVEKRHLLFSDPDAPKEYVIERTENWVKIVDKIRVDIKEPLKLLEDDFRSILGVVEAED